MTPDAATTEKTCGKCNETKPLEAFSRDRSKTDGRQGNCKSCNAAYYAENRDRIADYRDANRDRILQHKRDYYEANRERESERSREYHKANRGRIAERRREYYEANRDHLLEYSRDYHAANRERRNELHREWCEENPHFDWRYEYRRRALRFDLDLVIEDFTKADVTELYGDSCFYCETGAFEHLDHYTPVSKGGPHTLTNVRPACAACNVAKSDTDGDAYIRIYREAAAQWDRDHQETQP